MSVADRRRAWKGTIMKKRQAVDMLHGPLQKKLILFALPIAASSMFQQLFNAADTAVVGRFADADALAAVGTNGEIVALLVSLSLGLAVGANVLLARFIGSDSKEKISGAVHTAMALALIMGIAGALAGQFLARPLLLLIHTPDSVLHLAQVYLKIYFAGYPALLVYDFGAAILRAKGDSRRPFVILMISGGINVILNLVFVMKCEMGVRGVALATDIATFCSAVFVVTLLLRETGEFRLCFRKLRIRWSYVKRLWQIGIPAAMQGAVFCFANIFIQAAVNSFGKTVIAGSAIAMNYEYFGYYMVTAFGQAATTFVSQNYGAGQLERCRRILKKCLLDSIVFAGIILMPLVVWRTQISGVFSGDAAVVEQASLRVMCILLFQIICGFYEIPAGYLRGIGYSTIPAVITMTGTCLLRILWVAAVFPRFRSLPVLYYVFPVSWVITILMMWTAYGVICHCNNRTSPDSIS